MHQSNGLGAGGFIQNSATYENEVIEAALELNPGTGVSNAMTYTQYPIVNIC